MHKITNLGSKKTTIVFWVWFCNYPKREVCVKVTRDNTESTLFNLLMCLAKQLDIFLVLQLLCLQVSFHAINKHGVVDLQRVFTLLCDLFSREGCLEKDFIETISQRHAQSRIYGFTCHHSLSRSTYLAWRATSNRFALDLFSRITEMKFQGPIVVF